MAHAHLRLRFPGETESVWHIPGIVSTRELFCGNRWCGARIPVGEEHARNRENGQRVCCRCVEQAEVIETESVSKGNRRQRQEKIARAHDHAIRMLLDGLEVESIRELKMLVDMARVVQARILRKENR